MKNLSVIKLGTLAFALLCLVAGASAAADGECMRIRNGSGGATETDDFSTPFKGGAMLEMAGGDLVADVVTMLLGLPVPNGADMLAPTMHCFVAWEISAAGPSAMGHFCTRDKATLSPGETPAVLLFKTRSRIVGGEWSGKPVTGGRLKVRGRIDMGVPTDPDSQPPATAQWTVQGRVCLGD